MELYRQKGLQDCQRHQPQEARSTTSSGRILENFHQKLTDLNSEEAAHLKSQVTELYKAQNANLQTIKSLEDGLTSLQQAEKQLKQEYRPNIDPTNLRLSDLRTRRKDLELRAALHGETLREKNQQIQVGPSFQTALNVDFTRRVADDWVIIDGIRRKDGEIGSRV